MKSSNNQEFLKNLIKYVDVLVNTFNDNNLVAIKDMDLNYVYVSESFAKDIFGSIQISLLKNQIWICNFLN